MSGRGEIEADDIRHVIFLAVEKDRENLQGVLDDLFLKTVAHSFAFTSSELHASAHCKNNNRREERNSKLERGACACVFL